MVFSYCSNWETLQQQLNPEMSIFQQTQTELAREMLDTFNDPFVDTEDFLYSDNYTHLLPFFSSPSDPVFTFDNFECYQYPKRQKNCDEDDDLYYSDFVPYCLNECPLNCCPLPEEVLPENFFPSTEFQLPMVYTDVNVVDNTKKPSNGCLSAQSIAARQRRRKITEKTQELGKLIPGGKKMNTAEMFQAAFKYVKYLQAQVGILELMATVQKNKGASHEEELQVLLASPIIQQKLYSEKKCLVPKEFAQVLEKDNEFQSHTSISKDVVQLIQTES